MEQSENYLYPHSSSPKRSDLSLVPASRNPVQSYNSPMASGQPDNYWNAPGSYPQKSSLSVSHINPPVYGQSKPATPPRTDAWHAPNADSKGATNKSMAESAQEKLRKCLSDITAKLVLCCLGGFIIAAIPLAVMTTLWVSSRSSTTTTVASVTATTSVSLPIQCYSYSSITDISRNQQMGYACCYSPYDSSLVAGWYRFSGQAGTRLANSPITTTSICGQSYPGYFNGTLPATAGAMTTGNACFYTGTSCAYSTSPISVINCDGYYIFYLVPTSSSSYRYCTTT